MKAPGIKSPAGNASFERPTQKTSIILGRLWKYLSPYKWQLIIAVIISVAGNLMALVGPQLSGSAIDAIKTQSDKVDFGNVFHFAGLMLIFYVLSSLLSYILSILMIRLSRNVIYRMRKDVFDKLTSLPVRFFDDRQTGDVISVISYDIDTVNVSLSSDLVTMFSSVITVIGSFVMMLTISPPLILIFAAAIPASMIFTHYRNKKVRPMYRERSESLGDMNGYVEEMTSGVKTVKAYCREKEFVHQFAAIALTIPGFDLTAVHAKGNRGINAVCRILTEIIVGTGIADLDGIVLDRIMHACTGNQFARREKLDLELAAGHVGNALDEEFRRTVQGIQTLREARSHPPFDVGQRGILGNRRCRHRTRCQTNTGFFQETASFHDW